MQKILTPDLEPIKKSFKKIKDEYDQFVEMIQQNRLKGLKIMGQHIETEIMLLNKRLTELFHTEEIEEIYSFKCKSCKNILFIKGDKSKRGAFYHLCPKCNEKKVFIKHEKTKI